MTTDERTPFSLPADHRTDVPIVEHPFYRWLLEQEPKGITRGDMVTYQYLARLGWRREMHLLEQADIEHLHLVHGYYCNTWMPTREPHRLDELFVGAPGGYWLRDGDKLIGTDHVTMTDKLARLLNQLDSLIYQLRPDSYYFEVVNGVLFIKYQHIIGSRRICPIEEAQ